MMRGNIQNKRAGNVPLAIGLVYGAGDSNGDGEKEKGEGRGRRAL